MIVLFHGHQKEIWPDLARGMFELRARVFDQRLKWEVAVENGYEIDKFDELDPLYAVYVDEQRRVLGTFRLLQSIGPTMLRDVFPRCLPTGLDVRSPIVWESTRFCVDTTLAAERGANGIAEVTASLLSSLIEVGIMAGLSHVVTVIDTRMERILRRSGCPIERLGDPVDYGGIMTLAILMECSEGWVESIQRRNNLEGRLIDPETFARLAAA